MSLENKPVGWLQIFFEVTTNMSDLWVKSHLRTRDSEIVTDTYEGDGGLGLVELAEHLADKYMEEFKDYRYTTDFYETIYDFVNRELKVVKR